jgi:hypothetical protein
MQPQQFAKVGEALYGPSWRIRMSESLDVAERTVRRWEQSESPIPAGIKDDLIKLCRDHAKELTELADALARPPRAAWRRF